MGRPHRAKAVKAVKAVLWAAQKPEDSSKNRVLAETPFGAGTPIDDTPDGSRIASESHLQYHAAL